MERPRLRRLIRRPRGAAAGYTLVEVIVAMLISCIMVTSMFSVAITQKASTGKSDRRILANQGAAQISAMLTGYVTGCGCNPATGACSTVNNDCTQLLGPNKSAAGAATWFLNGDAGITDSRGNVYALTFGNHTLTNVLPAWFEGAPYNARVSYTVTNLQNVNGRPVPQVAVTVNWTEP